MQRPSPGIQKQLNLVTKPIKPLRHIALLLCLCCAAPLVHAQHNSLAGKIKEITDTFHGHIGVCVAGIDFSDKCTVGNGHHYPMQSTFKFPLALYILHLVDEHKLALDKTYPINTAILDTDTWSPIVKEHPLQKLSLTLQDLLMYSVSYSDNNACDLLFGIAGGTNPVDNFIHDAGFSTITIKATEAEMKIAWEVQYTNWCFPDAMNHLLRLFYHGHLISPGSHDLLLKLMTESKNPDRIMLGLPKGTKLAHKTGTSNTNNAGLTAATNDIGIITLPDGRHIAVTIYVSDYYGGVAHGEQMIGLIGKAIWQYYTAKQ